ncbi:hypothetical protein [Caenispirillum bisanense]|uniref:hypothetical protein n=1 Tax=Caenispirillum bisanense TaxID=414052 RepID=UPI0031D9F287
MPRLTPATAGALAAAALLAAAAPAAAQQAPTELAGLTLGMTLDQARTRAVGLKLPFNGCDTVTADKSDGRPLVTICSHQGLEKGTQLDAARTDLQVWADGAGTVFAIRASQPISCQPEEQVAVVRDIQARYKGFATWRPAWSWSGSDGTTALDVEMKNADAPCAVLSELRTIALHDAVAEALRAEFD